MPLTGADAGAVGVEREAPLTGFILYNAAALAVAALLYAAIERPGLRLRARLLTARTPALPAARPAPDVRENDRPLNPSCQRPVAPP
jgi:peptidoglycan/LPS O-acetylase OafA/YrhL